MIIDRFIPEYISRNIHRPRDIYYLFALVLFYAAVNSNILFLDSTLMPSDGLNTQVEQNREISKSFTSDPAGTSALYQFDKFAFHEISNNSIPYWNPYTLLGMPFLAEYQWEIFYPLNYIRVLLPWQYWDYYSYLHLLLLSVIVYFLSKKLYRDRRGSFVASISIFCTGFFLSYLPTYTIINVIPWGFLLILSMEGLIRSSRNWYSSLGVVLAVYGLGTAGHPTLAIFMTLGALLFFAFRMLFERSARRALVRFSVMSLVGALLAAPNIGPFFHYMLSSEGGVVTQWWDTPPFYTLRHFASFIFPYLFGSINESAFPSITAGIQPNSGFFWGVPPILFLAFLGAFFSVKNRSFALLSLALSGLVLSLWGFGLSPFSFFSSIEVFRRLNPNYVWSFPAVIICVLAGYGTLQLRMGSIDSLRIATWTYLSFILLMLLYVIYLGIGLDLDNIYASETLAVLCQGLVPGALWSVAIPFFTLIVVGRFNSGLVIKSLRTRLAWVPIILAIGFSGVGYYPSGNLTNHAIISISSLVIFILFVFVYCWQKEMDKNRNSFINFTFMALILLSGWSSVSNYLFPSLPKRYETSIKPDYIELLSRDRLNWRSYGIFGEILTNSLAPFRISTLNNQNALAPIELRQFFHDYLDSYQDTTMFYGVKYNTAVDGEPMNQFHIHRKFWDYVGVRYILSPPMFGDARKVLETEINGYEAVSFEGAHPIAIPFIDGPESPVSSFLTSNIDCSNGAFTTLRVRLSTYGLSHSGRLFANVFSPDGKLLAASSLDAIDVSDNAIHSFDYENELCGISAHTVTLGLGFLKKKGPEMLFTWHTAENKLILSRVNTRNKGIKLISPDNSLGPRVYENMAAMPRTYIVKKLRRVDSWRSAQKAFSNQQVLRDVAFVEESNTCAVDETRALESNTQLLNESPTERAEITQIKSSEIQLQAQVNQAAVLVLVDTFAPGWTASVNGLDVPIFRINGLFRGICLPKAGSYRVSMKYRPPYWGLFTFLPIVGVSILVLLALLNFFTNCHIFLRRSRN